MKFTLEIQCDNAAFEEDAGSELAYILDGLGGRFMGMDPGISSTGKVLDNNGNTIGKWTYERDIDSA